MRAIGCTLDTFIVNKRTYNGVFHATGRVKPFTVEVKGVFILYANGDEVRIKVVGKLLGMTNTIEMAKPFNLPKLCPVGLTASVVDSDLRSILAGEEGRAMQAFVIAKAAVETEGMVTTYSLPSEKVSTN